MQKHVGTALSNQQAGQRSRHFTVKEIPASNVKVPEKPLHLTFGISEDEGKGLDILMNRKPYSAWNGEDMQRAAAYVDSIYARQNESTPHGK